MFRFRLKTLLTFALIIGFVALAVSTRVKFIWPHYPNGVWLDDKYLVFCINGDHTFAGILTRTVIISLPVSIYGFIVATLVAVLIVIWFRSRQRKLNESRVSQ